MPLFSILLSGLIAGSIALSAIANNLATLDTAGYKVSSVQFSDLLDRTLRDNGSGDSIQVGAGTEASATAISMNSGSPATTGVPTDVVIIELDKGQINPPRATSTVQLTTNLDASTPAGDTPLSTPVTVYDSQGTAHVLNFNFTKTGAGAWNCNIAIANAD
ncbi:MAG TPA: flagellar basal body FlgE domain-containing protein, partial [Candidatus Limnocylindrales bacterium]|nr:flagellar basal body FlgE domain-containing protein [Candidatus Limnocylindrales bacterium]